MDSEGFSVTLSGTESTPLGAVGLSTWSSLVDAFSAVCPSGSSNCSAGLSCGAVEGSGLVALFVTIGGASAKNIYEI